jgi:hypothetical protein
MLMDDNSVNLLEQVSEDAPFAAGVSHWRIACQQKSINTSVIGF